MRELAIMVAIVSTSLILAGCHQVLQERIGKTEQNIRSKFEACDRQKAAGILVSNVALAHCKGEARMQGYAKAKYPLPLLKKRLLLEETIAEQLDEKKIDAKQAAELQKAVEIAIGENEMNYQLAEEEARSQRIDTFSQQLLSSRSSASTPRTYNTLCSANSVAANCTTTGW